MALTYQIRPTLTILSVAVIGCSGAEPSTSGPASPTDSTARPSEPAATAAPTSEPTTSAASAVDLVESKNAALPDKLPKVRVDTPGNDQRVPGHYAQTYKVRYKVTNWTSQPEGSYVQFLLDDVPYAPVTDPKRAVTLKELAGGDIAEGEHVLAAYVARKTHESIKAEGAVSVRRFWVGKRTAATWNSSRDPLLIVGRPHGTYEGEEADRILVDYYVINAALGSSDHTVRFTLKGPSTGPDGLEKTVDEWRPLLVWSPGAGDYTLEAELLDAKAQPVKSPHNPTKRTFTVRRKP